MLRHRGCCSDVTACKANQHIARSLGGGCAPVGGPCLRGRFCRCADYLREERRRTSFRSTRSEPCLARSLPDELVVLSWCGRVLHSRGILHRRFRSVQNEACVSTVATASAGDPRVSGGATSAPSARPHASAETLVLDPRDSERNVVKEVTTNAARGTRLARTSLSKRMRSKASVANGC